MAHSPVSQPVSQPASQPANQTLSNRLAPGSQQATAIHPGNQIASASLMFFYGKRRFFFFFYLSRRRDLTRKPTCSNIFLQQIHFRFRVSVYKKKSSNNSKELTSSLAIKLASSHPSMSPSRSEPSQLASQQASSHPLRQPDSERKLIVSH